MDPGSFHLFTSPWLVAMVLAIVFIAAIVQVGLGMGFGLTAAPLLALLDPELVPASTLFIGLATSAWGAFAERDRIVWREVWIGTGGRLAGVVAATLILSAFADRKAFMVAFGAFIAIAVVLSVSGRRMRFSVPGLLAMTTLSGLMGTITSVGAPPLALVYQDRPPASARPTLAAFFMVGCAISLAGLYLSGWAGPRDFLLALVMLPGMLAGILASRHLKGQFDRRFRPVLLAVAAAAAFVLILRGLS